MGAKQHTQAGEPVIRVSFALTDPEYPFVGASAADSCSVTLEEIIPRGESGYAEFFYISDADSETIFELADEHGKVDAQLLDESGSSDLYEFVVSENCPAVYLGEQDALPREVYSDDGEGRIVAEIPQTADPDAVIERFLDDHPDAELVNVETTSAVRPMFAHREAQHAVEEHLDEQQQAILEAAHETGYYDWPRKTSADELAQQLDIDSETLDEQLRRIEQTLILVNTEVDADGLPEWSKDSLPAQSS